MKSIKNINLDLVGALASGLCLIHCLVTPVLFIAKVCSASCCSEAPFWWKTFDYVFLAISFIAIFFISKNTKKYWLKIALWISWGFLLLTMVLEVLAPDFIPESIGYIPALSIVALHIYNYRTCKCADSR